MDQSEAADSAMVTEGAYLNRDRHGKVADAQNGFPYQAS